MMALLEEWSEARGLYVGRKRWSAREQLKILGSPRSRVLA